MAGSQLKQLKAALKSNGLIGQTNIKKKNKKSKAPSDTRRNDKESVLSGIRSQFNQFDQRINRTKHDVTTIQGGSFVKVGSKQHNDATRTNSNIQNSMKLEYETSKKSKGRNGGIVDRRFGENNKDMTAEEKMLERFTRERQAASKRGNLYSLGSDNEDDEDDGFTLTHSGKSLAFEDEFDEGDLGVSATKYVDQDSLMPETEEPVRKKSKNEVMKEIIAKSKFYKQQRQAEFQKTQDQIMDLDDEFADVMGAFNEVKYKPTPKFSTKTEEEIQYDTKVKELTYEKRSVPADRTKTVEELNKEHDEKLKKLESDRLKRMNGLEVEDREAVADDIDDGFWDGSDDEANGFTINNSQNEESEEDADSEKSDSEAMHSGRPMVAKKLPVLIPATHFDFVESLRKIEEENQPKYIGKIIETYKPHLAEGNKEKMNIFVNILFEHILFLSDKLNPNQALIEKFSKVLKTLAESYNETLVNSIREAMNEIQTRILESSLRKKDLVFFVIIGYLFSTSDHYHLIVTPALILMNEALSSLNYEKNTSLISVGQGIFLADMLLNYQRFSKRFIPEIVNFLEKSLLLLIPEPTKISDSSSILSVAKIIESNLNLSKSAKFETYEHPNITLSLSALYSKSTSQLKFNLIVKILYLIDKAIDEWKDKSALIEITGSYITLLKHLVKYYAFNLPSSTKLLNKLTKLRLNAIKDRKPLTLQYHKKLAIATFAPKFEENFNPDKKSYDVNRERQELNKIKNQIKKERKSAVKDIRKQTRFDAREQIKEKKDMYDSYHKKMANIVNSISTIEGAEKNQYEREKQKRKNQK